MKEKKNRPIFVDSKALEESREKDLGRPLTGGEKEVLNMADAIRTDALACGRNIRKTVKNYEMHGSKLPDSVKSMLGLIPPTN